MRHPQDKQELCSPFLRRVPAVQVLGTLAKSCGSHQAATATGSQVGQRVRGSLSAEGTADKGPTDPQSGPPRACDEGTAPSSAETHGFLTAPGGPEHRLSSEQQPPARPPCPCSAGSHPSKSLGVTRLPLSSPHCPPGWVLLPEDFSWVTPNSSPCRGAWPTTTPPPERPTTPPFSCAEALEIKLTARAGLPAEFSSPPASPTGLPLPGGSAFSSPKARSPPQGSNPFAASYFPAKVSLVSPKNVPPLRFLPRRQQTRARPGSSLCVYSPRMLGL